MRRPANDFAPMDTRSREGARCLAGWPRPSALDSRDAAAAAVRRRRVGPHDDRNPHRPRPTLMIGYIHWLHDVETISLIFTPAANNGRAGAEVGVADNNTTGRFLQQNFALQTMEVRTEQDPVAALDTMIGKGIRLVVTDRPAADVLKLADAGAPHGVTIFNAGAPDDSIRERELPRQPDPHRAEQCHVG